MFNSMGAINKVYRGGRVDKIFPDRAFAAPSAARCSPLVLVNCTSKKTDDDGERIVSSPLTIAQTRGGKPGINVSGFNPTEASCNGRRLICGRIGKEF